MHSSQAFLSSVAVALSPSHGRRRLLVRCTAVLGRQQRQVVNLGVAGSGGLLATIGQVVSRGLRHVLLLLGQ